jgi:glycosyltransferase involved in cell wall biosynthesis
MIESNFSSADISYVHFCHSHYLRRVHHAWSGSMVRSLFRWLDHWLHAWGERSIYKRVPYFVVPSAGLKLEIEREYPFTKGRIGVIHNPLDLRTFEAPPQFERDSLREALSIQPGDCGLVFVALGHFERKGLPALLQALSDVNARQLKLVVVGGTRDALAAYRDLAARLGLAANINFVGAQRDVRPYLWAADAFVLPSSYETFSLVTYEAAAAALPMLVAPTSGIEDILVDGGNGISIGTRPSDIAAPLRRFLRLSPEQRRQMGQRAREAVQRYSTASFVSSWRAVYEKGAV